MTDVQQPPAGTVPTVPGSGGRGASAPRSSGSFGLPDMIKIGLLVAFDGLALWGLLRTIDQQSWAPFGVILVGTILVNVVYATRRFIPAKYLLPGFIFMALFAVFPVIYTVFLSFTNYGTGNILNKDQAIATIETSSVAAATDAPTYRAEILRDSDGELFLVLVDEEGQAFVEAEGGGLQPADQAQVTDGKLTGYEGATILNLGERSDLTQQQKDELAIETDDGIIRLSSLTAATVLEQRFQYDADRDVMVDTQTGDEYVPQDGQFVSAETGAALQGAPGWTVGVGFDNYKELFTSEALRSSFLRVFVWTLFFSFATVAMQFGLGLLLAMVFNNERLRGRKYYRVLMIIPYALPTFMMFLVWRGMLNQTFGIVNEIFNTNIPWLTDGTWARFSVLMVNLWAGFPYFFLVTTGALQGIPSDLSEAAFVDGATGLQAFRKVTFPLLLVATAPVLISSFAFNFNNFNLIEQLTAGGPPVAGEIAGETDILITFTNTIAFGGAGSNYGLATAISVIIFMVVAIISAIGFKFTGSLEEVR